MVHPNWFYTESRAQRSQWLCERFHSQVNDCNSILDVGCSEGALKHYLPENCNYTGVDIAGNPDLKINLDEVERLPFTDAQFDGTICADVLEHLENIHEILDELCRVSRKFLIITLPNPVYGLYRYVVHKEYPNLLSRDREGKYLKFYGLPPEKPSDRHRWFFGYQEAVDFVKSRAKKNRMVLECIENNLMYESISLRRKIIFGFLKHLNPDLVYRSIIFLLKRKE